MIDKFVEVAVFVPLRQVFDFLLPKSSGSGIEILPGSRVLVPFGHAKRVGVVLKVKNETAVEKDKIKPVIEVLDEQILISEEIIQLCQWSASYYHYPIGEVFQQVLPGLLRQADTSLIIKEKKYQLSDKALIMDSSELKGSKRQQALFDRIGQYQQGLTSGELAAGEKNGWKTAVKALLEKDLIEIKELRISLTDKLLLDNQKNEERHEVSGSFSLNHEQKLIVDSLREKLDQYYPALIFGITGSGKTEVYLQFMETVLCRGKQVLVMVPEINLTPQLLQRFSHRFKYRIVTLHSSLNHRQRMENWLSAAIGAADIVIGTRSSVLVPMPRLGAIIMDEEHDSSYKQQEGFRYHARDIALYRASKADIPIVLGSATPSLESLLNSEKKKLHVYFLRQRAGKSEPPLIQVLDVRNKQLDFGISYQLKDMIEVEMDKLNQVIIFQNRRGFSPITFCHQCGWIAKCVHCDANLIVHKRSNSMHCHHCESTTPIPQYCQSCNSAQLEQLGAGTERIEDSLQQIFPETEIIRIDRDTTRKKDSFQTMMEKICNGKQQILVGTQMLAKGHHFPNVTLVVILDIDQGLFSTDFRSTEKLAQMLLQIAGRAGREAKKGQVVIP